LPGIVQTHCTIRQARPIAEAESLTFHCVIDGHEEKARGIAFELVTKVYAKDELVWTGVATMLRKTQKKSGLRSMRPHPLDGLGAQNTVIEVPRQAGWRFARATGDFNPIHLNGLVARLAGFKGPIAHGMWTVSRVVAEHEALIMKGPVALSCEFKHAVALGSRVIFRHWPESDGLQFRVFDAKAQKLHLMGGLMPLPPEGMDQA
jgi:hypothetical protein